MKNSTTIDSNQLAEDLSTSTHYSNDHDATFSIPGIVKSAQEQLVDDLAQEQVYKETRDRMFEQSTQQVEDDDNWVSNFLGDVWRGAIDALTWKPARQIANTINNHGEDMYTRWWDNHYKGESDRAFGDWSNNHLLQLQIEDAINYIRYIQSPNKNTLQVDEQTLAKWENGFDEVANKIGLEHIDREYADQIKREQRFNKSRFSIEPKTSTDLKFLFRQKPELLDQYATNLSQRSSELGVEMDELIKQGYELQETRKEWLANRKPYSEEFLAAEAKPFFQDFESTLIKIPGLMGSSSTGLEWQALNYATSAVNGALVSTGAAATLPGVITLAGGVGLNLYSQIKSREAETHVEIWNSYKDRVFSNLTQEAREQVLRQAREQAGEDASEEELITGILTGRYQVSNGDYTRKSLDALSDLSYLYNDNMVLATSDVLQTSLTVVPFAAGAAKWVKSGIGGTKLMRGASNMIDKAVTFGVAKDLKNLAKLQLRHKYATGIGGVVGSSYLELAEEGKQWFSADRYKRGDYNYDPGFIPSMLNLMKDGVRVPISFFDRELMSNADYVEGLKGGALLGGGMGAVLSGTTGMVDAYQTNKSSKELVQIMGHDYFADREDIRTGVQFAEAARRGRTNRLNEAFDFIKKYNLSELDSELIQAQQDKANRIISAYQNKNVRNAAKSLGIIKINIKDKDATNLDDMPGTRFDVYLALRDFYNRQFENAKQVKDRYANVGIPGIKVNTDGTISAGDKVFATNTVQLVAASQLADQSLLDIDAAAQQSAIDAIKSEIKFVDDLATDLRQSGVKLPNSITESLSNVVRRQLSAIQVRGIGVTPEGLKDTEEFKQAVEDYKRKLYADAAFDYYLHKARAYEGVRDIADNEVELLQKVYDAQGTPKTPAEIRKQHEKNNDKIREEVANDIARYFGSIEDDVNLQQNIDELNEQSAKESAEEPVVVTNNDVDPETQEPAIIIPENAEESTETEESGGEESTESIETLEQPIEEQTQVETQPEETISEDATENEQQTTVDAELDIFEKMYSPEAIAESQPRISKEELDANKEEVAKHKTTTLTKIPLTNTRREKLRKQIDDAYETRKAYRERLRAKGVAEHRLPELLKRFDEYTDDELAAWTEYTYNDESLYGNMINTIDAELERVGQLLIPYMNPELRQILRNQEMEAREAGNEETARESDRLAGFKHANSKYKPDFAYAFADDVALFISHAERIDEGVLGANDWNKAYAEKYGNRLIPQEAIDLAERWEDLYYFREIVDEQIYNDPSDRIPEVELIQQFGDLMQSSEAKSEEVESKQVHEEEQSVEEITIPELHRESYHMDGLVGKYEENKPYIENSAKEDFLSASDLYFTLEGDDVYLIVNYKGTPTKVKFTEGYFSKTGINETEVNKEIIAKVKALLRSVSGTEKRVIPLGVHRSTPDAKFGRNAEGLPEYKALSLQMLGVSSIFDIDLSTVPVAISHSNGLYLNKIPYNNRVIAPGTAVLLLKPKFTENAENTPVQIFLHHTMFSERPEMATTIVDALLNINASNFKNLPISSQQLIMFFLNFGETTKIDERTAQMNPNLKKKEIYFDTDGKLIVAGTPFILDEARNNSTIRRQLMEKIQANLNFKIDETYLNVRFNGLPTTHPLRPIYDYFRLGNTNAISIGGVTFTKEHFGFGENKKAVTLLGWLIDQQILTSDFVGFSNAKISIKDAAIAEPVNDVSNIQPTPANPKSEETISDEKELASEPEFDAMSELFGEGYSDLVGPNKIIPKDANIVNQVGSKEAIEVRWVEDVLGLSEEQLKILPDFLEDLGNNLVSVGRATEDGITLSQGAPVGTTYHEAFHRVANLFLKGWQRKLIYDRARKRYKMPNLTDVQIDELLADDYANFMVNEGIKLDYQVKGMFKKINLFRHIASKTNSRTFAAFIYYVGVGKFKKAKPSARNKARFKDLAASGAFRKTIKGRAFKHISSNSQISNILDGLQFALLRDVVSLGDVSTINLEEFGSKIQKLAEKDVNQKYPALQDIAEHWDFFKKELVNKLSKFDTDKQLARQINEDIENTDGDGTGKDIAQHDKNSYESSHYQSAPKEVKFFFSRLAMTGFDADGNEKVVIDPSTGFPRIINSALAWNTVLNDLHNCDSVQSLLDAVNKLAQQDLFYKTVARHLNKYVAMSKSSNKDEALVADTMLTKLLTTIHSHKHTFLTGKINNRTDDKYEVQIIDNGVDIMSVKYPKVWSASLVSSEADSIFQATESGIKVTNNGLNTIRRCRKAYNNLTNALNKSGIITVGDKAYDLHRPENLEKAKNQIVAILNSLGIAVDKGTIEEAMRNPAYGDQLATPYDRFKAFVLSNANFGGISSILNLYGNDTNPVANILVDLQGNVTSISVPQQRGVNKEYQPRQLYENQGFVKFLSSQFVKHAQNTRELRSIGAQGNLYYPISQNNYASDHVNELNQRGQVVDNLRKVHWSSSSLILDQLNNPNTKLTLETLIAFRTSDSRDQGRDYFDITDREDYITKMALTATDRIVFPTVADKKTYHTITGIRLFHDNLSFSATKQTDGKFRLDALFSDAVTSQFIAYAMSELAAIEQCIEQVNGGLDKSQFIKNYHTNNFYKTKEVDPNTGEIKEVRHTVSPNGTRFRFLTGVYVYEDVKNANGSITTKEKFVSFNDPKETAEKNLEIANKYFFGEHVSDAERRFMISKLLQKQVEKEIKYLAKIGVIDQNSAGQIKTSKNNLLDQARLAPMIEHYKHLTDGQDKPVQFVQNGAEGYAIYNMIAQHVANTIVSVHEIEALFSGDPAYYKWFYDANGVFDISVDKIKRLGALTSTGKNNRVDFEDWVDDMYTVAELKDHEVGSQQYEVIRDLAYQGNLRRVVRNIHGDSALYVFKDENVDGENISVITRAKTTEELEQEYASDNVKNEAIVMTTQEFSGYSKDINVADAAVYISPNMYKRLMQSIGEFGPEVEEAFNILTDPNTSIDSFYKMELYSKLLAASLKPLKYMATAQRFENGLGVPYFNKMALFPVFDFIATGDMRKVYKRMMKPGDELDMIMFNSAVKAGSKDAKSAYVDGQMSDLDNLTVYTQSFKYIRQQLATDPHTHEEQMAGTQMLKVSMSNLELSGKYGNTEDEKVTGRFIRDNVIKAMNELSNRGVAALRGRFLNADGSFNQEEFSKMLYEELQSRDADDNMLDGVSLTDGKLTVPLASMSNTRWLESILISMINKATVDIYLPGGAFIQRSTFGLDATRQDVISDRMLNNGRKLTLINDDGSMDAIVSINLFSHIIPGYKNKTFAQSRQWLIDNGIIGDSAKANAIGYRIPTQSQASISALRFVDVLPSIMGDTIVLPEEFTKLTGSDFDVDKLYVSRYQYEIYEDSDGTLNKQGLLRSVKKARKVEFDEKKSYADNSEEAIKNRLIEMYLKILTDKSRTNELKISIDNDTELVKSLLDIVESDKAVTYPKPFEVYTPQYQEERKAEYTTGKAGIGPMALNNAHHILTQLYNVRFKRDAFTEGLGIVDTNRVYDKDGNRVLSWLSAMINAFVDIAKDPYITRLNVNPWTYNMATYMIRVGFGKNTFFMLNQPIIKEMAEAVAKTKGKYGIDQTKTPYELEQEAIEQVLKKYDNSGKIGKTYKFITDKGKPEQRLETYRDLFETDLLQKMITDKDSFDSSEFNENQVRVYYAYKLLSKYAQGLADLVKYSKVDTKKTGKSFFEQMIFREGMRELERSDIFETGDVRRFFESSFIETKTENSVDFGRNLFRGQLFDCNPVVIRSAKTILESIGRSTNASEKLLKTIIGATEAQIKSEFILKMMERDEVTYDDLLRGDQSVAVRLAKLIKDIRTGKYHDLSDVNGNIDNALLNYLLPICDNTGDKNALNFISTNDKFMQSQDANVNDIIYGWEQLLSHPSDEIKKFATDLIYYSFITSGDTPGSNSFFGYVPNSWRIASGYAEAVGNVASSTDFNINRDLIYRNNTMDSDLVPAYDAAERTVVVTDQGDEPSDIPFIGINSKYTYPGLGHSVRGIMLGIRDINGQIITRKGEVWPQYIKTKVGKDANNRPMYALYKLAGTVVREKGKNSDHIPMYVLTSRKGYRNGEYRIIDYRNEGNILENNINEFDMNLFNDVDFCRKVLQKLGELFVSMTVNGNTVTMGNESEEQVSDNPTEFVNHSGGAPGSDTVWGQIAEEYGIPSRHYYHGEISSANAPLGNTQITEQDYEEGKTKAAQAAKRNWGYQYQTMKDDRLVRNWSQVKYADEIFAIGQIVQPGEKAFPNQPNDTRVAVNPMVAGGTGYAVGMAINEGKPVHVFDQIKNKWYIWNGENFVEEDTPTLSKNFAGIGTRQINESGKQAIRNVFNKTFNKPVWYGQQQQEDPDLVNSDYKVPGTVNLPTSDQTINIWHGSNENADLSNLATRPFTTEIYGEQVRVNSVEQAFQLSKLWESFDEMDEDQFNELEQKIMSETDPYKIKKLGRSFKMSPQTRSSWDDMSSDVMYKLIKESFQQNPDALQKLLATGDAVLTHNQEEGKWQTEFPRMLMEVREELRETTQQLPSKSNSSPINLYTGITAQYGVTIDTNLKQNWRTWQNDNPDGIVAYRVNFNNYNTWEEAAAGRIGNPFSEESRGADTVEKFYRWLANGETFGEPKATEEYREAIIVKLLSVPENTPILYYKELNRPSHATILGYLLNNKQMLYDIVDKNYQKHQSEILEGERRAIARLDDEYFDKIKKDSHKGRSVVRELMHIGSVLTPFGYGPLLHILFDNLNKNKFDVEIRHLDKKDETRDNYAGWVVVHDNGQVLIVDNQALNEKGMLHEIVHAYTLHALYSDQSLKNKIQQYMDYVMSNVDESDLSRHYGFTNVYEFVAEFYTNPDFIELLTTIPPMDENKFKNLFQQILDTIVQFFVGDNKPRSVYEQFTPVFLDILDKDANTFGKYLGNLDITYKNKDSLISHAKSVIRTNFSTTLRDNILISGTKQISHNDKYYTFEYIYSQHVLNVFNFRDTTDSDYTVHDGVSNFAEKQSLFDGMSQDELNAIEKQKEEHNKKCNR